MAVSCGLSAYRHWLLGHPVPATALGFPCGRLTGPRGQRPLGNRTLSGFPCSTRVRNGWGWVSSVPRGQRCPNDRRRVHDRRLPHHNGNVPTCPALQPDPGSFDNEASARISDQSPHASLPLTCNPQTEQEPLGFPVSFAPSRHQPRTSRWGRISDTDPKSHRRHRASTSNQRTHLQRATSCRNAGSNPAGGTCRSVTSPVEESRGRLGVRI